MVGRHLPKISFAKYIFENTLFSNCDFDIPQNSFSKKEKIRVFSGIRKNNFTDTVENIFYIK